MSTTRVNPFSGNVPGSARAHTTLLDDTDLLGEEKAPISLIIPKAAVWKRLALAFSATGLSLAGLVLLWGTLHDSFFGISAFTTLVVGLSVVGGIWGYDKNQKRQLRNWEPFLMEALGSVPPISSFYTVGDATDALCLWFKDTLEEHSRDERSAFVSTIVTLARVLEARDVSTRNHSAKVAALAVRVGRRMGLSQEQLYAVHLAGLLHDIGKIGIRDDILLKSQGLTRVEFEAMKAHPQVGYEILSGVPGMTKVAETVRHHHEMWNGSGYPGGLREEAIPLGARLVAAADTYMALVEDRPYREGRSVASAIQELKRVSGRQLDPVVTEHLTALIDEEQASFQKRRGQRAA